jgi:hypothetical protein
MIRQRTTGITPGKYVTLVHRNRTNRTDERDVTALPSIPARRGGQSVWTFVSTGGGSQLGHPPDDSYETTECRGVERSGLRLE